MKGTKVIRIIYIFVLFFLLLISACTKKGKEIYNYHSLSPISSPIVVSFVINDDKGTVYSLKGFKTIILSNNIEALNYSVVVKNPDKFEYSIYSILQKENGTRVRERHLLSNVSDNYEYPHLIPIPLPKNREVYKYDVYLATREGDILFSLLPLTYKFRNERPDEGGGK